MITQQSTIVEKLSLYMVVFLLSLNLSVIVLISLKAHLSVLVSINVNAWTWMGAFWYSIILVIIMWYYNLTVVCNNQEIGLTVLTSYFSTFNAGLYSYIFSFSVSCCPLLLLLLLQYYYYLQYVVLTWHSTLQLILQKTPHVQVLAYIWVGWLHWSVLSVKTAGP